MNIDTKTALKIIAGNEYTVLVVSPDGEIQELITLTSMPTPEIIMQISENNKGNAYRILQKSSLTETELRKEIESLVEAIEWAKTHKLKWGENFPDKHDDRLKNK
jgi:hypothetical protein